MRSAVDTTLEFFFDQFRDIYSMEVQLCESMSRIVSLCTNEELCALIQGHDQQNCYQILEISAIFERHGQSPGDAKCKAMG